MPDSHPLPSNLSQPAQRALAEAGYTHLEQLTGVAPADLLKLHGMGPKGIAILQRALADLGLTFAAPADRPAARAKKA